MIEEEHDEDTPAKKKFTGFSAYNSGDYEYEDFKIPKVDANYANKNLQDCYNSEDYNRKTDVERKIHELFEEYYVGTKFTRRDKIPKLLQNEFYIKFKELLEKEKYTSIEIFIGLAEYFDVSHETFYSNISAKYKEDLIRELDHEFGILKSKKIKYLF